MTKEKERKAKTEKIGTCPFCGSENIDYGDSCIQDDEMYYEVYCTDCNENSKEWYCLEYLFTEEV